MARLVILLALILAGCTSAPILTRYGEPLPPRPEGAEIKIAASSDSLEIIGEVSIQEKVMNREIAIEKLKAAARQMGGDYLVNIEHDPENSNPLIDVEWRAKVGVRKEQNLKQ